MKTRARLFVWIGFIGTVLLVLGLKARQLGWLEVKPPLELNDQPAVLIFIRYNGACECELFVNGNARAQVANWVPEARGDVQLHQIDIEQRSDLARQYKVIRAPSMLLLDASGQIIWRQDDVLSDGLPLDLAAAEVQIAGLLASEERWNP
ncbi:MAG: hypothetical protein MUO62_04645 [Anaerolineales bacterium]|nr:hypothetical protein [Anaerolineales bacterium]